MNNNDIFKKLRVALQLRDEQIMEILELVDFRISKAELGAFFRSEDHPNYMECGDQVLRNFLNGLVIHLRGTKDNPKNAMDVINQNRDAVKATAKAGFPKDLGTKNAAIGNTQGQSERGNAKPAAKKPFKKPTGKPTGASANKRTSPKIEVVEKVKFNNGKKKK